MKQLTHSRKVDGTELCTRVAIAARTERNETQIRRYLRPIACDVHTRALLYDLAAARSLLARVPRRETRRVA